MNANTIVEISHYLHSIPEGKAPSEVFHELESLTFHNRINTILSAAAVTIFTVIFGYFNHADAWGLLVIGIAVLVAAFVRELVIGRGHGYYIGVLATTLVATIAAALLSQVVPTTTPLISLIIPCVFVIPGFQLDQWRLGGPPQPHAHRDPASCGLPQRAGNHDSRVTRSPSYLHTGNRWPGPHISSPVDTGHQRDPWRGDRHLYVRPHECPPPGYPRVLSLWCGWPDSYVQRWW